MKPSDFNIFPWDSVFHENEYETIALNIIRILKRTGNEFRDLSWNEYKTERLKDGSFTDGEFEYFEKVIPYFISESTAKLFSPAWRKIGEQK